MWRPSWSTGTLRNGFQMGSRFSRLFPRVFHVFPSLVSQRLSPSSVLSPVFLAVLIQLISPGLFHFTPSDCISSPVVHQLTSLQCLKPDSRPDSHSLPDWSVYVVQALRPSSAFASLFFCFFLLLTKTEHFLCSRSTSYRAHRPSSPQPTNSALPSQQNTIHLIQSLSSASGSWHIFTTYFINIFNTKFHTRFSELH